MPKVQIGLKSDLIDGSRHAQRQMKWRKIAEADVESTIADPDMQLDSIKGEKERL